MPLYLEDLSPGWCLDSGSLQVSEAMIRDFARRYDPQPMHLDPEAARDSLFGELVGSGWHALALTMRLMVQAPLLGGTPLVGVAMDAIRFRQPLRPGDTLSARAEVLEVRRSGSRPDRGYVRMAITTVRADGQVLLTMEWTMLVPARPEVPG